MRSMKLFALKKDLAHLRRSLLECRPKLEPFSRMHSYQEDTPPHVWKQKQFRVVLRQLNADVALEDEAIAIGRQIKQAKVDIKEEENIIRNFSIVRGHKAVMREEEIE